MARKAAQTKPEPAKSAGADKPETVEQPKNTEGAEDARSNAAKAPSTPAAEQGHQAAGGDDEPPAEEAAMIVVTGPERGRRRIGLKFGPEPVLIPVDDLTEAEIAALTGDPMLRVVLPPAPDA